MDHAATQATTHTQALHDTADQFDAIGDHLVEAAALITAVAVLILAWQMRIRIATLLSQQTAALQAVAGRAAVRDASGSVVKRLTEAFGKLTERPAGTTRMNMSRERKSWFDKGSANDPKGRLNQPIDKTEEACKKCGVVKINNICQCNAPDGFWEGRD